MTMSSDETPVPGCPFTLEPDGLRCPYPYYESVRAQGDIVWEPALEAHVVSSYELVTGLLRRPELASSNMPTGPGFAKIVSSSIKQGLASGTMPPDAARYLEAPLPPTVFRIDPPDHSRQRQLVSRILTPRRARRFEPMVKAAADELAANLGRAGRADAVATFARPLPERVILPLLRMPEEMTQQLRAWTTATTDVIGNPAADDQSVFAMTSARAQMADFFGELLESVRTDLGDDLVSSLIEARLDNGDALTEGERIGLLINFLVAGNETSIKAMSAGVRHLATRPDVWAALEADRSKVAGFVEELLRLEPPTQGMFRQITADVELNGYKIGAGDHVYLNFAAANRDPTVFAAPEELDLEREEASRHVSFGHGPHTCLGAWLARLEITAAVNALVDQLESIALAPENTFDYEPSYLLHGLQRLDVVACARNQPDSQ